jgi:hypothetical protein
MIVDEAEVILACMGQDEASPAGAIVLSDAVGLSIFQHYDTRNELYKSLDARLLVRPR